MRAVWAAVAVFALAGPAAAQEEAPEGNVRAENVDTWTITTVDGNEFEVRPATPSYRGDTGLFHLSSAYTLPKGKVSVSGFRDNLDRDPQYRPRLANAAFHHVPSAELLADRPHVDRLGSVS